MSFASKYRGKELTVMVKLLSVFGVVEVRQMRENHDVAAPRGHGLYDTGCQISGLESDVGGEGRYQQQRILLLGAYQHQRQHTGFLRW